MSERSDVATGGDGALGRISLQLASSLDLDEVLGEITRALIEDLDAALARIWLLRPGDSCATCAQAKACATHVPCLHLVASAGVSERTDGAYRRVPVGALKIGVIASTREPICTTDLAGDARIADKAWVREHGLGAFAGYPLVFRGEVLGVLAIFAREKLSAEKFDRLAIFAAHSAVAIKNARLFDDVQRLSRRLEAENAYLKEELRGAVPAGIVGDSPALRRVLAELDRVAPTSSTVLLSGETGTGKELFARAVHERSPRRDRALVKVNCAAISPSLVESELFGHERGAFTGALQRRIGRFELADGGTLFLDEIGELSLEAQAKLLRVLQEHEVERLGGTLPIRVDVRIVCATNRDLSADVRALRFRADLFYRINVFPIEIPPLRQRREDIPLLVEAFAKSSAQKIGRAIRGVDDEAMAMLALYDWPGNVRELYNVLERAAILAEGPLIGVHDLPELRGGVEPPPEGSPPPADVASLREHVEAYERTLIADALKQAGQNQSEAARLLRTSRATLLYKIKAYGL